MQRFAKQRLKAAKIGHEEFLSIILNLDPAKFKLGSSRLSEVFKNQELNEMLSAFLTEEQAQFLLECQPEDFHHQVALYKKYQELKNPSSFVEIKNEREEKLQFKRKVQELDDFQEFEN